MMERNGDKRDGNQFKSSGKDKGSSQANTRGKWALRFDNEEREDQQGQDYGESGRQWNADEINDFLLVTRNRTRKYIE